MNKKFLYTSIVVSLLVASIICNNSLLIKNILASENSTSIDTNKPNEKYISIIQNIRNLLEQLSTAYETENYQKASQLAVTAYLDNYEYLETPLEISGNGDIMKELELKMRVDLREAIKDMVSQREIDKLIDDINTELFDVAIILDPKQ
jgi:hypothetical protein